MRKSIEQLREEAKFQGRMVFRAIASALDPFIDAMPENGTDDDLEPKIAGLLFGVRAYLAEFQGLEAHLLQQLVAFGHVKLEDYQAGVATAELQGLALADRLAQSIRREN